MNAQAFRSELVSVSVPRGRKWGVNVLALIPDGLGVCCDAPRKMKLTTNGKRTEKCANCGAEAIRE